MPGVGVNCGCTETDGDCGEKQRLQQRPKLQTSQAQRAAKWRQDRNCISPILATVFLLVHQMHFFHFLKSKIQLSHAKETAKLRRERNVNCFSSNFHANEFCSSVYNLYFSHSAMTKLQLFFNNSQVSAKWGLDRNLISWYEHHQMSNRIARTKNHIKISVLDPNL